MVIRVKFETAHRRRALEEAIKARPKDIVPGEHTRTSRPAHEGRRPVGSHLIDRPRSSLASGDLGGPRDNRKPCRPPTLQYATYQYDDLAYLPCALVTAAVEGRFSRGIGVAALRDAPAEWSQQMRRLGLAPAPGSATR